MSVALLDEHAGRPGRLRVEVVPVGAVQRWRDAEGWPVLRVQALRRSGRVAGTAWYAPEHAPRVLAEVLAGLEGGPWPDGYTDRIATARGQGDTTLRVAEDVQGALAVGLVGHRGAMRWEAHLQPLQRRRLAKALTAGLAHLAGWEAS